MITDEDYRAWLIRGGRRVALIEIGTDTPRFVSTVPYTTLPTDSPANVAYLPVAAKGFSFSERLSYDGNPSISAGDIELQNEDGSLDSWLNEVWVNRPIKVYVGDVEWARGDFKLEFDGIIANLESSRSDRLNIVLRNKLERLNTPASEALLEGTTPNKDRLLPSILGEVHNVEPLLIDPPNHGYMVHNGPTERIIEVRDNGVPVDFVATLPAGTFRLTRSPEGTITASVQGFTPYVNTAAKMVQVLSTNYGKPTERLTVADLDLPNLNAFDAAHPQAMGLSLADRTNVLQACQQIAASIGAQVTMTRQGLLRLAKITLTGASTLTIDESDYEARSLSIQDRTTVVAGVRIGYCKNWTVQNSLNTGIPAEHKDMFAQEWLTVSSRDEAVAAAYRLYADIPQEDTLLLVTAEAQAEADRRLALWGVPHTSYRFKGYGQTLMLELGQLITLKGSRWGLSEGKLAVVISLQRDWISGRCDVEVLT